MFISIWKLIFVSVSPLFSKVGWLPSIMIKSLFVCGVLGGKQLKKRRVSKFFFFHICFLIDASVCVAPVLLVPAKCSNITVCIEEDRELRVDCLLSPKALKTESYTFLWSSGPKQMLINSNVSGSSVDNQFKGKSVVTKQELGYRMTLQGFTENLPPNTTFVCTVNEERAQISLGKGGWVEFIY